MEGSYEREVDALRGDLRRIDAEMDAAHAGIVAMQARHEDENASIARRGLLIEEMGARIPCDPWFRASHARLEELHRDACVKLERAHEAEAERGRARISLLDARYDGIAARMRALVNDTTHTQD